MKRISKFNNDSSKLRSKLEETAWNLLTEAGIEFTYEPYAIELMPAFVYISSYERSGKTFKRVEKVRPVTYTPDFVGDDWILETKGMKTPDFNLKWKMLKQKYSKRNMLLLMPSNKKEIIEAIELIKSWPRKKRILKKSSEELMKRLKSQPASIPL